MSRQKGQAPKKSAEERQRERRDRFVRLAEKRVNRAVQALHNVARLGNKAAYDYRDDEAAAILGALSAAFDQTGAAFIPREEKKAGFVLF